MITNIDWYNVLSGTHKVAELIPFMELLVIFYEYSFNAFKNLLNFEIKK